MARGLKRLLRPDVLIPVVLIVGVIALLFGFGDPARILATMESFNRVDLIWVFLLTATYEAIRFVQWWYLLRHAGIHVPLKAQVFSFAGGEATRFLPIGNYFENYLLTAAEGVDFGFSSAVTTLTVLLEVAVSLTGLVILGLGSWWWVRPLIIIGVAVTIAFGLVLREEFRKALHAYGAKQKGQLGHSKAQGEEAQPTASPDTPSDSSDSREFVVTRKAASPRHPVPRRDAIASGRWRPRSHEDSGEREGSDAPASDPTSAAS